MCGRGIKTGASAEACNKFQNWLHNWKCGYVFPCQQKNGVPIANDYRGVMTQKSFFMFRRPPRFSGVVNPHPEQKWHLATDSKPI